MLHLLLLRWCFTGRRLPALLLMAAGWAFGPAQAQPAGRWGVRPLPPALATLLPAGKPNDYAADIRRLWAARSQWNADSLSRLLVFTRLGLNYRRLNQNDSVYYYFTRAWHLAAAAQRHQPAEVVEAAKLLAIHHYTFGSYDSTRYYFRQATTLFRAARLDSLQKVRLELPSTEVWTGGGTLTGILANAGSASRALGNLPEALRYYEQAMSLYQRRHDLSGVSWTQSLMGETYAEQDNPAQARLLYEQALGTARHHFHEQPRTGSKSLADVLLNYYAPLLLAQQQATHAARLASEVRQALLAGVRQQVQYDSEADWLLARTSLVRAQAALQTGQSAAAGLALDSARYWLRRRLQHSPAGLMQHDRGNQETQVATLGLEAWRQHATNPTGARRLLDEATALLAQSDRTDLLRLARQQLAGLCLAMHEPARAARLLRPLLRTYQQSGSAWPLSQVTRLLTQAYDQAGRFDSAYYFSRRTQGLTDTVREQRQFAALAATEARFRTREQAGQIRLLTRLSEQRTRSARLAGGGAVVLAVLALALGLAWRTTRRLNGQLAAQAAQLGKLDEAKNQFFANVSHELRTPLTLVLGPLDTLLTSPAHPLPAAVQQPVALAYRQAQRLLHLVNRILDLTKLQAGRVALHPVPTSLAALLRRVVAQFESLAAQRGIALHSPQALPDDLRLLLDADKVEEVLTNLLINALNYTPVGGTVRVSASLPGPGGSHYGVTVADTGPGIAEAEQARVFERYYQSQQRPAQGGTGLGLALSRELAQLLGGTLTLVSEPEQGAAFTLRFPAEVLPAAPEPTHETPDASLAIPPPPLASPRPRVLVVEDQPDLREYLRSLLAPAYEVLTAADGQAALDLLAQEAPIDLLATDAMMPRLSGTELLARLRAEPGQYQAATVPVLMLTARADEAHRLAALRVGIDDYLTKPFVPAELLARVRVLLARQQVRQQFATLPPEPPAMEPTAKPLVAEEPEAATPALAVAAPTATRRKPPPLAAATQLAQWQGLAASCLADEQFGPAELAELLCLSERTLYRRLGELAGLTPAAWLRELRLTKARQLLEAGSFSSVAEVADAVGFASPKYFASLYTERFGRRPSDYRA